MDAAQDNHHQQQAPQTVQEPEAEQSVPSAPPPSHGSTSSIAAEAHRHHHQPGGSQPAISVATALAQSSGDHLRIRHFTLRVSPNSETLVHFHVVDVDPAAFPGEDEARSAKQPLPVNLGKVFVGLTYQAMVSFMVFHYSSSDNVARLRHARIVSTLLDLAEVGVMLGFAASLIGLLIRKRCIEWAMILEKVGIAYATLGFFLLVSMFFTEASTMIALLGGVGSFAIFVLVFIKMNKEGNRTRRH